jgi:YHS domain-containing protein
MEDHMKSLTKVWVVIIAAAFLFSVGSSLNAAEKKVKKADKDKSACCSVEKCCMGCHKKLDKDAKALKMEHKGKTYHFCSEKCMDAFKKDPEKYIAKCKAAHEKCCDTKVVYTCPMKQCNVTQDKPGKCPKCGMTLKKVVKHAENCEHHKSDHKHEHKSDHKHDHKHDQKDDQKAHQHEHGKDCSKDCSKDCNHSHKK